MRDPAGQAWADFVHTSGDLSELSGLRHHALDWVRIGLTKTSVASGPDLGQSAWVLLLKSLVRLAAVGDAPFLGPSEVS